MEQLESELKSEIDKQAAIALEHQQKLDSLVSERDGHLETIRKDVEDALKNVHQAEITRLLTENESKVNELKREHILLRDQEKEALEEKHKLVLTELAATHSTAIATLEAKHKISLSEAREQLQSNVAGQTNEEVEALNQKYLAEIKELEQVYQSKLQAAEAEAEKLKSEHTASITTLESSHRDQIEAVEAQLKDSKSNVDFERDIQELKNQHAKELAQLHQDLAEQSEASANAEGIQQSHVEALDKLKKEHLEQLKEHEELSNKSLEEGLAKLELSHKATLAEELYNVSTKHQEEIKALHEKQAQKIAELEKAHLEAIELVQAELKLKNEALSKAEQVSKQSMETHRLAIEELEKNHESKLASFLQQIDTLQNSGNSELTEIVSKYEKEMNDVKSAHEEETKKIKLTNEEQLKEHQNLHEKELQKMIESHGLAIDAIEKEHEKVIQGQELDSHNAFKLRLETLNETHEREKETWQKEQEQIHSNLKAEHAIALSALVESLELTKKEHEAHMDSLKQEHCTILQELTSTHTSSVEAIKTSHLETMKEIESRTIGDTEKIKVFIIF